jgi:hypothetical protein
MFCESTPQLLAAAIGHSSLQLLPQCDNRLPYFANQQLIFAVRARKFSSLQRNSLLNGTGNFCKGTGNLNARTGNFTGQ